MICIPKRTKKAQNLSLLFTLTGLLIAALSSVLPYSGIFSLAAIIPIVIGIQLLAKFVLSEYVYIIEDKDDGTSEMLVMRRQGKREAKLCHISLSQAKEIFKKGDKKIDSSSRFNYCQNLTDCPYVLVFDDGDKCVEIIFEPDPEFLKAINERMGNGDGDLGFMM